MIMYALTRRKMPLYLGVRLWGQNSAPKAPRRKNGHYGGLIFDFLHKIYVIFISFRKNLTKIFQVAVHNVATVKSGV